MGKVTCLIEFDGNPMRIYYGGQTLNGRATLTFPTEKKIRGIYVLIEGGARTRWTTGSAKHRKTHTGREEYLSEKNFFMGGTTGEIVVQPGVYTYTFQSNLPFALPTSFEGRYGYIRYTVLVNVDIPMWPDDVFEEPLTIIKTMNLNELPHLTTSAPFFKKYNFIKYCCILFCFTGADVNITGSLQASGFTPKQSIYVNISTDNGSDVDIVTYIIKIVQHKQYFTHKDSSRRTKEKIVVAEKSVAGCASSSKATIDECIVVPVIPPTDTTSSDICKIYYEFQISSNCDVFCQSGPEINIPITIGTIPLMSQITDNKNYPTNGTATAPISEDGPSAPLLSSSDIAPPTYEEAMDSIAEVGGHRYVPHYPVYHQIK